MKRVLLICLILYGAMEASSAQTAILSGGGDLSSSQGTVSFSIGQSLTSTITSEFTLFNGIQLPDPDSGSSDLPKTLDGIDIYSNPSGSLVTIHIHQFEKNMRMNLFHINGIFLQSIELNETTYSFNLPSGFYLITIENERAILVKSKIVKY